MVTFLELIGAIGQFFLSFTKNVTDEGIRKNIESFKKFDWFQVYLKDDKFGKLINENTKVRYEIGKCNIEKVNNHKYISLYQKRIDKVLKLESNDLKL